MNYDLIMQAGRCRTCGGRVDASFKKGPACLCAFGLGMHRRRAACCGDAPDRAVARLASHTGGLLSGAKPAVLLRALGIALVAQFAADTCREAGLCAASTAIELCGRVLVLLQALPLLRSLLGSFADYLQ